MDSQGRNASSIVHQSAQNTPWKRKKPTRMEVALSPNASRQSGWAERTTRISVASTTTPESDISTAISSTLVSHSPQSTGASGASWTKWYFTAPPVIHSSPLSRELRVSRGQEGHPPGEGRDPDREPVALARDRVR